MTSEFKYRPIVSRSDRISMRNETGESRRGKLTPNLESDRIRSNLIRLLYNCTRKKLEEDPERQEYFRGAYKTNIERISNNEDYFDDSRSYWILQPSDQKEAGTSITIISRIGAIDTTLDPHENNDFHKYLEILLQEKRIEFTKKDIQITQEIRRACQRGGWPSGAPDPTRFDVVEPITIEREIVSVTDTCVQFTIPYNQAKLRLLPALETEVNQLHQR